VKETDWVFGFVVVEVGVLACVFYNLITRGTISFGVLISMLIFAFAC